MYEVSQAYKTAIEQQSRNFRLSGNIRLQSGDTITLSDSNVVGEMKIETQCMSGSSSEQMLDIGAVCAAKLTMTVKNASGSDSFADARVRPLAGLEISKDNFEDIPMGIFYVDNTTVERVKDRVTFSAYDKMIFLHFLLTDTMRSNMKNMPPYASCAYVCSLAGIQMAQSSAEVTAFPNGSVLPDYSDASIETARDLIMWCAQLMGCFARIDRHGKLEFVQLKAENDEHGMIIPVREIAARQRYSTKFADGVIRITRLTMKKSDGKMASAAVTYTGSTKRSAELELEQNPLILSLTDKTVKECLRDILRVVKTAYFRPFQSEIASDPALDAGDYVRLRGGSIDTNRGYGTGIITHNIWRYRDKHRIVNVGSVPAMYQLDDESSVAETAAVSEITLFSDNSEDDDSGSDNVDGTDLVYVPPKSQLEKEIDALRGKLGSGGKPTAPSVEMPYMDGINYYYIPETRAISEKLWKNHLSGEADNKGDISLPQGAVESGCALTLENKQYGNMSTVDAPATYYCLVKNNELLKNTRRDMLFGAVFNGSDSLGITMTLSETKQNYPSETTNNSMGYKIQYSRVKSDSELNFLGYTDFSYQVSSISNVSIDGQAVYFGDQNWYEYSTSASGYDERDRYLLEDGNIVYSSQNVILLPALQQHFLTEKDFTDYHVYALSIIPNEELKFSVTASSKKYSVTPQNLRFYVDGDLVGTSVFFPDKDNSKPSVRSHYLHFNIDARKAGSAAASYLSYAIGTTYHNAAMVKANSEWLLRKAVSDWKS